MVMGKRNKRVEKRKEGCSAREGEGETEGRRRAPSFRTATSVARFEICYGTECRGRREKGDETAARYRNNVPGASEASGPKKMRL